MDQSWRWFHCTTHTYGSWLHGDSRGFRTRHHRDHIVGDYRSPPPKDAYLEKLQRSRRLLKQDPVHLSPAWQNFFGNALREKLVELGAQVLCISLGPTHAHCLAKMPPERIPRLWIGQSKKHANFLGKRHGWTGKLWAVRSKITPIRDRKHQLNTYKYILDHIQEQNWVWDFRQG